MNLKKIQIRNSLNSKNSNKQQNEIKKTMQDIKEKFNKDTESLKNQIKS
jgi:hypothetical protein